jgi:DNA-binding NarL/FixJ family response regulator
VRPVTLQNNRRLESYIPGEFFFDSYITELMLPELTSHAANIIETRHEEYDFLSHREQEVFRLLAEGHTNRAIASVLYISHRTVENYKSGILKKLGLNSNAELVRYAQKIGILD